MVYIQPRWVDTDEKKYITSSIARSKSPSRFFEFFRSPTMPNLIERKFQRQYAGFCILLRRLVCKYLSRRPCRILEHFENRFLFSFFCFITRIVVTHQRGFLFASLIMSMLNKSAVADQVGLENIFPSECILTSAVFLAKDFRMLCLYYCCYVTYALQNKKERELRHIRCLNFPTYLKPTIVKTYVPILLKHLGTRVVSRLSPLRAFHRS